MDRRTCLAGAALAVPARAEKSSAAATNPNTLRVEANSFEVFIVPSFALLPTPNVRHAENRTRMRLFWNGIGQRLAPRSAQQQ